MKLLQELLQLNEKKGQPSRTDLGQRPKAKWKKKKGAAVEDRRAAVADTKYEDGGDGA